MTIVPNFVASASAELPAAPLARWASAFFSLSVLALPISLAASQAFLAAASVAFAFHLLRDRPRLEFFPVKLPLAFFCLFSVISVFWAANPTVGWFAVRKLVLFLIWLLAVNLAVSAEHLKLLYQGLFLESALAGFVAVGQFVHLYRAARALHPDQIYIYMTVDRVRGFMGHWMNFGGQQMLLFTALLSFLLFGPWVATGFSPARGEPGRSPAMKGSTTSGRPRKAWWGIFGIIGISIVLNLTRGVWLGCFVAVIYLVGRWKPRWLWALPVLLFAGYLAAPTLVRQRVKVLLHPTTDPSLSIRFEMWQVALRMIQKHPLLGVGPNNIVQVYMLYLPPGKVPVMGYHEHLHNNFLQLGAERGLLCLASWIWLMAALGWHLVQIRRQLNRGRRPTWIADIGLAAWLAFVVEGCTEFNFGTSPVLMLFLFVTSTPFVVARIERPAVKAVTSDK